MKTTCILTAVGVSIPTEMTQHQEREISALRGTVAELGDIHAVRWADWNLPNPDEYPQVHINFYRRWLTSEQSGTKER